MKTSIVGALLAFAVSQSLADIPILGDIIDENDWPDVVEGLGGPGRVFIWDADDNKLSDKLRVFKEGTIEEDKQEKLDDSLMEDMQAQLGADADVPFCNSDNKSCEDGQVCWFKPRALTIDGVTATVVYGQCGSATL